MVKSVVEVLGITAGSRLSCQRHCCLATALRFPLRALSPSPPSPFTQRERNATALWLPQLTLSFYHSALLLLLSVTSSTQIKMTMEIAK